MNAEWDEFISGYLANKTTHDSSVINDEEKATLPNGIELVIRCEREDEADEVDSLTRRTFWGQWEDRIDRLGGIGCDEHYLCRVLRKAPEFIRELDLVALDGGRIVGNVMFTHAYVSHNGEPKHVLNFGPLSVLPEYRGVGVGGAIMRCATGRAKALGYGGILFYGHPTYYPRLGFTESSAFGISTANGDNFPAFMGMELIPNYLSAMSGGRMFESPMMEVDSSDAREYDKRFEPIPKYEIREISDIHLPFLHRLWTRPEITESLHMREYTYGELRGFSEAWKSDEYEVNLIIYKYSRPAGWMKLNGFDGKETAWVSMLAIMPEYQRQGIGGYALDCAESRIASMGHKRIGIHTTEDNAAARAFYEKHGYAITERGECTNDDGVKRVCLTYIKAL